MRAEDQESKSGFTTICPKGYVGWIAGMPVDDLNIEYLDEDSPYTVIKCFDGRFDVYIKEEALEKLVQEDDKPEES